MRWDRNNLTACFVLGSIIAPESLSRVALILEAISAVDTPLSTQWCTSVAEHLLSNCYLPSLNKNSTHVPALFFPLHGKARALKQFVFPHYYSFSVTCTWNRAGTLYGILMCFFLFPLYPIGSWGFPTFPAHTNTGRPSLFSIRHRVITKSGINLYLPSRSRQGTLRLKQMAYLSKLPC